MVDAEIEKAKREILSYLRRHPDASDDMEGIARFWVTRERIEAATGTVAQAVNALVSEGLLRKVTQNTPSGAPETVRFQIAVSSKH